MTPESSISTTVMRRVRRIAFIRLAAPPFAGLSIFALALWSIGREVWVAKVFANMPPLGDLAGVFRFYASALQHTDVTVQALSLLAFAAIVLLARGCAQALSSLPRIA